MSLDMFYFWLEIIYEGHTTTLFNSPIFLEDGGILKGIYSIVQLISF